MSQWVDYRALKQNVGIAEVLSSYQVRLKPVGRNQLRGRCPLPTHGSEPLHHQRVLQIVHNPRYAGAFVWGRRKGRRLPNGHTAVKFVAPEEWISLVPGAHV